MIKIAHSKNNQAFLRQDTGVIQPAKNSRFKQLIFSKLNTDPVKRISSFVISPFADLFSGRVFKNASHFKHFVLNSVVVSQIFGLITAPGRIISIYRHAIKAQNATKEKKLELAFEIADDIRLAGGSIGGFFGALTVIKALPKANLSWVTPFTGVMGLFSIGTLAKYVRKCILTHRMIRDMTKIEKETSCNGKMTLESLKKITKLFSDKVEVDKDFIVHTFGVKEEVFVDGIINREKTIIDKLSSTDEKVKQEGQKLLEYTLKSLKGRIRKNIISASLAAAASVINVIGTVLLLAMPICPVGLILIGIGGALEYGVMARESLTDRKIKVQLGILKPYDLKSRCKGLFNKIHPKRGFDIFHKAFHRLCKSKKEQAA